jgi:hypothetical protein
VSGGRNRNGPGSRHATEREGRLTRCRHRHHFPAVLAVFRNIRAPLLGLIVAVMGLLPPPGSALCIGPDGHLVLELTAGLPCVPQTGADPVGSCDPDDCRSCQDLSLSAGVALHVKVKARSLVLPVLLAPAGFDHLCADLSANAPAGVSGSSASSYARPLDTIVLRC